MPLAGPGGCFTNMDFSEINDSVSFSKPTWLKPTNQESGIGETEINDMKLISMSLWWNTSQDPRALFHHTFHQFQFHFIGFSLTISLSWLVGFSHVGLLSETENPKCHWSHWDQCWWNGLLVTSSSIKLFLTILHIACMQWSSHNALRTQHPCFFADFLTSWSTWNKSGDIDLTRPISF